MTRFLILAATALSIANPVLAAGSKAPESAPVASSPATASASAASPERRYCVDDVTTGSRIPHRSCRTRADWLRDGFDPLAK